MIQANWTSLGSPPTGDSNWVPQVVQTIDGRLEVFAFDSQGTLWNTGQSAPNGTWNPWVSVAGPSTMKLADFSSLDANVNADGRVEFFALDSQGAFWHIWQTSPGGGWSQWSSLGKPFAINPELPGAFIVSVVRNGDGRLEVFTSSQEDGALWHCWQLHPGGVWSAWSSLGTPRQGGKSVGLSGILAVGENADGRLEVFMADLTTFWHIWQTSPGGGWSQWASLGDPFAKAPLDLPMFTLARNGDGRLEVFTADQDGIHHSWQITPNGGTWSPWALLAHPPNNQLGDAVVGTNADGHLETFTFDSHGALQHSSQQASGGSWSPWTQFETPTDLSTRRDLTTAQDADGRLVVFGSDSNGVLWLASQVTPGNWGT